MESGREGVSGGGGAEAKVRTKYRRMVTDDRRVKGVAGNGLESKEGSSEEVIKSHAGERRCHSLNGGFEGCGLGRLIWQKSGEEHRVGTGGAWGALWRFPEWRRGREWWE